MITVTFDMSKYEVKFKGHAGQGDPGHDLVCASASMLFYTLWENLSQMEEMLCKDSFKSVSKAGNASIKCKPLKKFEPNITLVYLVIYNGLQLLAGDYSDFIEVKLIQ